MGHVESKSSVNGPDLLETKCFIAGSGTDAGANAILGTVKKCYDNLKYKVLAWPGDFDHDLTLISAEAAVDPRFIGYNLPQVEKTFITPAEVWTSGKTSCYLAHYDVTHEKNITYDGSAVRPETCSALITGLHVEWPKTLGSLGFTCRRAFLWRTESVMRESKTDPDMINVQGASGALLCIGSYRDARSHGVMLQNFQEPILLESGATCMLGKKESEWNDQLDQRLFGIDGQIIRLRV